MNRENQSEAIEGDLLRVAEHLHKEVELKVGQEVWLICGRHYMSGVVTRITTTVEVCCNFGEVLHFRPSGYGYCGECTSKPGIWYIRMDQAVIPNTFQRTQTLVCEPATNNDPYIHITMLDGDNLPMVIGPGYHHGKWITILQPRA